MPPGSGLPVAKAMPKRYAGMASAAKRRGIVASANWYGHVMVLGGKGRASRERLRRAYGGLSWVSTILLWRGSGPGH